MTAEIHEFNTAELTMEIDRAIATCTSCVGYTLYVTKGKKRNRCHNCLQALNKFARSMRGRHNHYLEHIEGLINKHEECHDYAFNVPSCLLDMIPLRKVLAQFLLWKIESKISKLRKARTNHNRLVYLINITRKIGEYLIILQNHKIVYPHEVVIKLQTISSELNLQFAYATALYNPTDILKKTPPSAG